MLDDTIAAISTPVGSAGIGIVRISGPEAIAVGDKVFRAKKAKRLADIRDRSLIYGHVVDKSGLVVDEVLVSVMKRPHSFTAEDVVEINCHGGVMALKKTLETVLSAGARLAEPGEFSKRAFLNGRLDLAQAESVIDLINAKTEKSLKVAVDQLGGALSARVRDISDLLLELMAHIEAVIDFPEHEIEELSKAGIVEKAREALHRINVLLASADTGRVLREGLKTAIIGKPNVGKSSLLNALLREKRAIVTDIPGTTRDIIEEVVNIRGVPLVLIDTAGIRETEDLVEQIGVEKSKEMFAEADLVLLMIDASTGITDEDRKILSLAEGKNCLVIVNKTDLGKDYDLAEIYNYSGQRDVIEMSLLRGEGLEDLEKRIEEIVYAGLVPAKDGVLVTSIRHKSALEKAARYLDEVLRALADNLPFDCMAIDLKGALESLGEITGETVSENLVDEIFSRFCIGK